MSNVIEFPKSDIASAIFKDIRPEFDDKTWKRLGPVLANILERYGTTPTIEVKYPAFVDSLSAEDMAELRSFLTDLLFRYCQLCRKDLVLDLGRTVVEKAKLETKLASKK